LISQHERTIGLYEGEKRAAAWRLATAHERMPDEYGLQMLGLLEHRGFGPADVDGIALASVVPPLTGTFAAACQEYLSRKPLVVDAGVRTGVRIRYEDPKAVGADRVVDAAAVQALYGGPACIVDFGTGTTFDAISAEGDYLGGAIAPGIGIAAEALFQRAAKLPRVDLARPPSAIGRNTVHAMQSGLLFGYSGWSRNGDAPAELGPKMKVIGTGGLVDVIAAETAVIEIKAPWLTLDGLRIVWEMNQ
jgi:type III pantothenate kinase